MSSSAPSNKTPSAVKPERNIRKTLGVIGNVLACIVLALLIAIAVGVLVQTLQSEFRSMGRIRLHKSLFRGFLVFFVLFLIPRVRSNVHWLMKFSHEFTHLLFALLFFRKINRFKVDDSDSYVSYSSGWFGYHAITLFQLINFCLVLLTPSSGVILAIQRVFVDFPTGVVSAVLG